MIFGVYIANLNYTYRSPIETLHPTLYPDGMKLLYNSRPVDSDSSNVQTSWLIDNLPSDGYNWSPLMTDETLNEEEFYSFSDAVYEYGLASVGKMPYQYGAYEIYQANTETQEYKFLNYVNMTSRDASILYPQFMYESILKVANDDPDFEFKVTTLAYPVSYATKVGVAVWDGGTIVFFAAIAYSLLATVTISYLVQERISMLKHVQVISGMRLSSYWIANFIFDFFKFYVTVVTTLLLMLFLRSETLDYDSTMWVYALCPFGIIPCTYVMSFIFTVDSAAQTMTMFFHFMAILIAPSLVFILRFANELEHVGDQLNFWMRICPSYSLGIVIFFENGGKALQAWRRLSNGTGAPVDGDEWALENNVFDMGAMGVHFFFWSFVLFLIEIDLGKRLRRCYTQCCFRTVPSKKGEIQMDDDVLAEEENVRNTPNDQFKIKVEDLRKVYWTVGQFRWCCRKRREKDPPACSRHAPLVAVEGISFGLKPGECFALLGVNGAGKSTTFKSLTSEVEPTSGQIHIGNLNVRKDFNKIRKLIGYCPQTNPIFDSLSVQEHVEYFAKIKGIPKRIRPTLVDKAISELGLENYR